MNQERSAILSAKDMIKLFQERMTNLCYHQLVDPVQLARLQQALQDRSLASRIAEALAFRDKSPDFDEALTDGEKTRVNKRFDSLEAKMNSNIGKNKRPAPTKATADDSKRPTRADLSKEIATWNKARPT